MTLRPDSRRRHRRECLAVLLLLAGFGGCGTSDADQLLTDLKSADVKLRRNAARMLGDATSADDRTIAALTGALGDADEEVRRWSAQGLGAVGAKSSQAALEGRLKDDATPVRRAAAFALQRLAPDSTAYRTELLAAMKSGDGGVIVALAELQPPPLWATSTLVEILKDRRPGIRRLAAEALGQLAVDDPTVRAALEKAQSDADDRVREAATKSLKGDHHEPTAPEP